MWVSRIKFGSIEQFCQPLLCDPTFPRSHKHFLRTELYRKDGLWSNEGTEFEDVRWISRSQDSRETEGVQSRRQVIG